MIDAFGVQRDDLNVAKAERGRKAGRAAGGTALAVPAAAVGAIGGQVAGGIGALASPTVRRNVQHITAPGARMRGPNMVAGARTAQKAIRTGTALGAAGAGYGGYKLGSAGVRRLQRGRS